MRKGHKTHRENEEAYVGMCWIILSPTWLTWSYISQNSLYGSALELAKR